MLLSAVVTAFSSARMRLVAALASSCVGRGFGDTSVLAAHSEMFEWSCDLQGQRVRYALENETKNHVREEGNAGAAKGQLEVGCSVKEGGTGPSKRLLIVVPFGLRRWGVSKVTKECL